MSSDTTYGIPATDRTNAVEWAEHSIVDGVAAKKVRVLDSAGNIINTFVPEKYDYIAITYPTTTSEVYTYKLGGSGGTTVATVTCTYTDTTKEYLSSVAKT